MKQSFLKTLLAAVLCLFIFAPGRAEDLTGYEVIRGWYFTKISSLSFTDLCSGNGQVRVASGSKVYCDNGSGALEGLFFQGPDVWFLHKNGYIYNNKGNRVFGISNLKAGDKVVIVTTNKDGIVLTDSGNKTIDTNNYTQTEDGNTLTWTVTNDGVVYAVATKTTGIYSITVYREKTDKPLDPTGRITAVNGVNRTVALSTETPNCEIYYTTDDTEPTTESTLYTEDGIVISQTTTIKAIAVKDGASSDVYTATFAAGTTIPVAAPTYSISAMTANGGFFYATYEGYCDNSDVLCKPTATLSATFNGVAVDLPYTADAVGTLVITASAAGYDDASIEVETTAYTKAIAYDFKSITVDDIDAALWGEPATGQLAARWTTMNDETVHYTLTADNNSTVFPGLTLYPLSNSQGTNYPALYIGYGIIWNAINQNYGNIAVTNPIDGAVIGVTTNGTYGTKLSTWYTIGNTAAIYRYDTALEDIAVYAPISLTPATGTIGANGWSTFSSAEPRDFTGLDVTPYIAVSHDGEYVTLQSVEGVVPANTGVMLKGEANAAYEIPTAAEAGVEPATNYLKPALAGTEITSATGVYVFANVDGVSAFHPLAEGYSVTAPRNIAYLQLPAAGPARLKIRIDGETGIEGISVDSVNTGDCYNIYGQRVSNPTRGLYIINGQKVIVK